MIDKAREEWAQLLAKEHGFTWAKLKPNSIHKIFYLHLVDHLLKSDLNGITLRELIEKYERGELVEGFEVIKSNPYPNEPREEIRGGVHTAYEKGKQDQLEADKRALALKVLVCPHKLQSKLIEIPGKDGKMWGTPQYEPDYSKLERIAHKVETGEGVNYCYMEFFYCNDCGEILELVQVATS